MESKSSLQDVCVATMTRFGIIGGALCVVSLPDAGKDSDSPHVTHVAHGVADADSGRFAPSVLET